MAKSTHKDCNPNYVDAFEKMLDTALIVTANQTGVRNTTSAHGVAVTIHGPIRMQEFAKNFIDAFFAAGFEFSDKG